VAVFVTMLVIELTLGVTIQFASEFCRLFGQWTALVLSQERQDAA
jgi:hypothetical protein